MGSAHEDERISVLVGGSSGSGSWYAQKIAAAVVAVLVSGQGTPAEQ